MKGLVLLCSLLALTMGVSSAAAGLGGNVAKEYCQKDQLQSLWDDDGNMFATQGACKSYAAQGGTLARVRITPGPLECFWVSGIEPCWAMAFEWFGLKPGGSLKYFLTEPDGDVLVGDLTNAFFNNNGQGQWMLELVCSPGSTMYLAGTTLNEATISSNVLTSPC